MVTGSHTPGPSAVGGDRTGTGPSPDRHGALTSAMRAAAQIGPKVLRIGLVESGRLDVERVFDRPTRITVGSTERCTFVIPALEGVWPLFEVAHGGYELCVRPGMHGRIALPTGIVDLRAVVGGSQRMQRIRLDDDARGKVVIGAVTFLFQFVPAPPVRTRPRLPPALTRGTFIDQRTTLLAGFSFLLHFLVLGALYSDWSDPVVDEELVVSGLIDSLPPIPPATPDNPDTSEHSTEVSNTPAKPAATTHPGPGATRAAGHAAEIAGISASLDRIEFQTVGALNGSGPAVRDVLGNREVPMGSLDDAASSNRGIGFDPVGLELHGGSGITPRTGDGFERLGTVSGATHADSGRRVEVHGPVGHAEPGETRIQSGHIPDAAAAIARLTAGLRRCYERGLTENPDAQGQIQLTFSITETGEVQNVAATPSGNLPGSVVACVRQRAAYAHFAAPGPGGGAVSVGVKFVHQR